MPSVTIFPMTEKGTIELHPNTAILVDGIRAPIGLEPNPRKAIQGAFRSLLIRAGSPAMLIEPASTTGGGAVHALQELVLAANRLATGPRESLADAVRSILWACRDLLGANDAAYAIAQAAAETVGIVPGRKPGAFERSKGFMGPLENHLEELGLPSSMDPERFGILEFQLDEAYDIACLWLQRFYAALRDPEPLGAFSAFARGFASTITKEIVPDQVLGLGAGEGREHTGLMDLLPELEREFL
jgi:hypothetical protein